MADSGSKAQPSPSIQPAPAAPVPRARPASSGPKRILCLDAGGPRAVLQLGILGALEARLKARSFLPDFRLCDYFDLFAGVSTGAYFAAELARGRRVADIEVAFAQMAPDMIASRNPAALDTALSGLFGNAPLFGPPWRSRFATFLKRRSDGAVLFVTDRSPPEPGALLHRVLIAATAAPAKLDSEKVTLTPDGGATPFVDATAAGLADPSLALFRALAAQEGGLNWALGPDRVLIVSVGSGRRSQAVGKWAVADALAQDAAAASAEMLRGLSEGARRAHDSGVRYAHLPMLRYERIDAVIGPDTISAMAADADSASSVLRELGAEAVQTMLGQSHGMERAMFPKAFNPPGFGKRPLGPPKIRLEALGRTFRRKD